MVFPTPQPKLCMTTRTSGDSMIWHPQYPSGVRDRRAVIQRLPRQVRGQRLANRRLTFTRATHRPYQRALQQSCVHKNKKTNKQTNMHASIKHNK